MKKYILIFLTFLSLVVFPWKTSLVLVAIASLFVPLLALLAGVLIDALYAPTGGIFIATLCGLIWCTIAYAVHEFLKTRIMT